MAVDDGWPVEDAIASDLEQGSYTLLSFILPNLYF